MDFLFNLWANSHLSNWSWMYFPNRLLFSLRTVFAFPNASRMGFESRILCSILFTLAISSFLCGKGENVIYLGISLCHGVTKRKIAARHRKMSPTWKKASYLEFVKSVMKCISFRVVHVCKNNKACKWLYSNYFKHFHSTPSTNLSRATLATDNNGLVLGFHISPEIAIHFLTNGEYMRRAFLQWNIRSN